MTRNGSIGCQNREQFRYQIQKISLHLLLKMIFNKTGYLKMRYFNTSGPNITEEHYTLPRTELVQIGKKMVYNRRYFTIWAPRQTGKSTYFRFLADALETEGYKVAHVNFENFKEASLEDFLYELHEQLHKCWGYNWQNLSLQKTFTNISKIVDAKLVLIVDEVEGINPDFFGQFLHSIRNIYHSRQSHALKSVILIGVNNIVGVVQDNASPFNIADNLNVPYFTDEETVALLELHEHETGQFFAPAVKAKIAAITANQPGLVNGFAWKLVNDYPHKAVIQYEDYLQVEEWYLEVAIDKNVSNIINKAQKYRDFIQKLLFTEAKIRFQINQTHIRELYVNGVIQRDADGFVCFHVPLYQKCLHAAFYPYLNGENDRIQRNLKVSNYFTALGDLNLERVIQEYKVYAERRGFSYFREKDAAGTFVSIKESALVYSFETFINAFLGVIGGKSYLEAHAGLGRTDLVLNVRNREYVVEAKVYPNITQFNEGKVQLAYYLKRLNLKAGFYLVFVDSEVTHPDVLGNNEMVENVQIITHLVRYDLDKDFDAPQTKPQTKPRVKRKNT
jgi:AAA-like domain